MKSDKLVSARHNIVLIQLCCHLVNECEITAAKVKHCRPKKATSQLPWRDPQTVTTKMWDTASRIDLRPCAKFKPNLFRSFRGDTSHTERQTDKPTNTQTNSKLNIPHYLEEDNQRSTRRQWAQGLQLWDMCWYLTNSKLVTDWIVKSRN